MVVSLFRSKCSMPNSSPKVGSGSVGDKGGAFEIVLGADEVLVAVFEKPLKDPIDFMDLTFFPVGGFSDDDC